MKKLVVVLLAFLFIVQLIIGQTDAQSQKPTIIQNNRPGLMNITELNVGFGLGDTDADFAKRFLGVTSVLGYGLTKNLHGGIGAGISFYNGGTLVPLFLDLRYMINFGKISAYALGDGGLLFNVSKSDDEYKILLNPGVGLKYPIGNNLSANLGAGLLMQFKKDKAHDSFVNLKMGVTYTFRK